MRNIITSAELPNSIGRTVTLHGGIHKIRRMRGFAFILLRTPREILQCVYDPDTATFPLDGLTEEACAILTGTVHADARSRIGAEVRLIEARVLSRPAEPLPVVINGRELDLSLSNLLDYRPLTLRHPEQRAVFRIQEGLVRGFRDFLSSRYFIEVHTPKLVFSGAEGGANVFPLAYFGKTAVLAQSPQFYKQMMVGVYERVFEIGPVFRAERHDTSRHLNEYTSMDLELGYIEGFEEIMRLQNDMLRYVFAQVAAQCAPELAMLSVAVPEVGEIPRMTFAQAKAVLADLGVPGEEGDFSPEEESRIGEHARVALGSDLVYITHYPSEKRPFYAMDDPADRRVTLSFDLLFRGVEITTGGQRIHGYEEQVAKMKARDMEPGDFASYLMIHKHGMPPHGGLGMGLERLTMMLLGQRNVRHATLFPRDTQRITP